jgi:hypothetical protein
MVTVGFNPSTLKVKYKPDTKKVCIGCCDVAPQYSEGDCCCFLNPSPAAWASTTVYGLHEAVASGGFTWYSLQSSNQNHEPADGSWWAKYYPCGNSDWDSVSGYGGVGRTPLYYKVTSRVIGHLDGYSVRLYDCLQTLTSVIDYDLTAVCRLSYSSGCLWTGSIISGEVSYRKQSIGSYDCSGVATPTGSAVLDLSSKTLTISFGFDLTYGGTCSEVVNSCATIRGGLLTCNGDRILCPSGTFNIGDCEVRGSVSDSKECTRYASSPCTSIVLLYESRVDEHSWVPE